jgi:hypothetical protein
MSVDMDRTIITDLGLISQVSYLLFGNNPLVKWDSFNSFIDDGINYTLNSSYTVIDYTSHWTDIQAILLEKNDSGGNPTGEYVIAFRGTEPNSALDWITNGLTAKGDVQI